MQISSRVLSTPVSPIDAAYALLPRAQEGCRLLDLAQAAPTYPPAPSVVEHLERVARSAHGADYVDLAGLPSLREAFAAELSGAYRARLEPDDVVITAGCNQAFCVAVSALVEPGDEVILGLPYYFNHDMWLRMNGIVPRYVDPAPALVPTAAHAEALITPRTRAIVLVTPGNPTGVTLSPSKLAEFLHVARRHDVALIVDETYRSFRDTDDPAHALFSDPEWSDTLVSLHSFSKELAIPGYRVGAVVASHSLAREMLKILDCVAICAPRIGQEAAWAGLTTASAWRAARAAEIADTRAALAEVLSERPGGFELLSVGGFFAWLRHPFAERPIEDVVGSLVTDHHTLVLPGTAFQPHDAGTFRVSVSNIDRAGIGELARRLAGAGREGDPCSLDDGSVEDARG